MPFDATTYEVDPTTLTTPRARLEYLRDFLRRLPEQRFNMANIGDWEADPEVGFCGSAACIGGWARALFRHRRGSIRDVGMEILGLDYEQADTLFFPGAYRMADAMPAYYAAPADAAQVLDHLIRTGEVDWSVARA